MVIVDPANSNTLVLRLLNFGVFRSTDDGLNWTRGMAPPPTGILAGDAHSLVLDTSATGSRILYTGIFANGVFRSDDGGLNWRRILSRTTPAVKKTALGADSFGKVVVDIAPPISTPNPAGVQIIYVTFGTNRESIRQEYGRYLYK